VTARFLTPLVLKDDGGFPMTLWLPLRYESALLKREIVVLAGFKTDLASIPAWLWPVLPKIGKWDKAAVIHDHLYASGSVSTRADADAVLDEALIVCGVPSFRRGLIVNGVRLGGWKPWNAYRKAQHVEVSR
jgi:hypothetical protein